MFMLLLPAGAVAQIRMRPVPPLRMPGTLVLPPADRVDDIGVKVEMFEDSNLDRFLNRAQEFLGRNEYGNAIKLLQDVIEGRTLETLNQAPGAEDPNPVRSLLQEEEDARDAVFAGDGRLYRPVRRLCQELLAGLPAIGLELYRQSFEVKAERLLDQALAQRDLHKLEDVYNRYFVTLSAGHAMQAAVDLQMDAGRYRSAIQILQDLLDTYPAESRRQLGISDLYLRVKESLCLSMVGEHRRADEVLENLLATNPDASLRVMGEISAVSELRETFVGPLTPEALRPVEYLALRTGQENLVPLWESRFVSMDPYKAVRSTGTRGQVYVGAIPSGSSMGRGVPRMSDNTPGTSLRFLGEMAVYLDNYCLRVRESLSGSLLLTGDETLATAEPRRIGQLRARIPLYDFSSLRVEADESRYYTVQTSIVAAGLQSILYNRMVAYDRSTMATVWDSSRWEPGRGEATALTYDAVTFLATPTVFGNRLLAPVMHSGAYALMCMDRETGRPLWRTRVHAGGSNFARAPGTVVQVQDGNAYVLTNAGALAAIDAFTGDLRWIRKYERLHPLRDTRAVSGPRPRSPINVAGQMAFLEFPLEGFVTSDMVLVDGLVIVAPSDGRVLLCVDGASGDPVWMVSRDHRYDFYGVLKYLVGHNSTHLYMASDEHVVCLDLRNGRREWVSRIPEGNGSRWRGRGLVTEELVVLPSEKGLLIYRADGEGEWSTMALPSFSPGREPLQGESNLFQSSPYLAVVYEGGVEVFSSDVVLDDLAHDADSPGERARYFAQAGRLTAAIDVLDSWATSDVEAAREAGAPARMLSLSRELALAMAANGSREEALTLLDRCRLHVDERELRQRWHLARMEVFRLLQDLDSLESEQQTLYSLMDGKG